jgi:hypothetical protein
VRLPGTGAAVAGLLRAGLIVGVPLAGGMAPDSGIRQARISNQTPAISNASAPKY